GSAREGTPAHAGACSRCTPGDRAGCPGSSAADRHLERRPQLSRPQSSTAGQRSNGGGTMSTSSTKRSLSRLIKVLPCLMLAAILLAPVHHARAQQPAPTNAGGGRLSSPEAQSEQINKQEVDENDAYLHSASVRKIGAMVGL